MTFKKKDLVLLQYINEEELYQLCLLTFIITNEAKRQHPVTESICELVELHETAAKEVARRKGWAPIPANGEYCKTGITYETNEYREWLRANCHVKIFHEKSIKCFSFGCHLISLLEKLNLNSVF